MLKKLAAIFIRQFSSPAPVQPAVIRYSQPELPFDRDCSLAKEHFFNQSGKTVTRKKSNHTAR